MTPIWHTEPWYSSLLQMSIETPVILSCISSIFKDHLGKDHPLITNKPLRLEAWKISGRDCILLTAKFRSERGASHHPACMDSSLTVSQMRLPCPPCGNMGLKTWTVVVSINKLSNLDLDRSWQYGDYVVELLLLKLRFDIAEMPKLFCVTATEMACSNDGRDYEVMYR